MALSKKHQQLIQKFITGNLPPQEKTALFSEAAQNPELADYIYLHTAISAPEFQPDMPTEKDFNILRATTINQIYRAQNNPPKTSVFSGWSWNFFSRPLVAAAFAILLFLTGFLTQSAIQKPLINDLKEMAEKTNGLQESNNSPYIYSNVIFREKPGETIQVSFDVSRHLEITGKKDDPLIQDILAQSLINNTNPAYQLKNINVSKKVMHPKIKQALIQTMLFDKNNLVRQKSMLSLVEYPYDKEVENAMLTILTQEQSVFMRIAAIEYLGKNNTDVENLKQRVPIFKNNSQKSNSIKQLNYLK